MTESNTESNMDGNERIGRSLFLALLATLVITVVAGSWRAKSAGAQDEDPPKETAQEVEMATEHLNELTPEEERVLLKKGTERPGTGKFNDHKEKGVYTCRHCNAGLYRSDDKFHSGCGWPSFDDEIFGNVKRVADADGRRVEILCARCGGHLGHVFKNEGFTPKNLRHCVNSVSLDFVPADRLGRAIFAGGCFWGVESNFQPVNGVLSVVSGYTGGKTEDPTYKEVCRGNTGHIEAVEIVYDTERVTYEALARLFFEIHDPTQANGQGPDIGEQYLSVVFVTDKEQRETIEKLIGILKEKGYDVVTEIRDAVTFYTAEEYHQNYYRSHNKTPYCHIRKKRFD